MEVRFSCNACGQHLSISSKASGHSVACPACGAPVVVPSATAPVIEAAEVAHEKNAPSGSLTEQSVEDSLPTESIPMQSSRTVSSHEGDLTCPVCWLKFDAGDVMHVAVHDSLRGDPVLGEDAPQRFHATRFSDLGQALDAMGLPATDIACPHCRRKFPPGFLDVPYHIVSLVGDQSAGKSYYLSVLAKVLPASLYQNFGINCQDADPTGNAPLNEMRKVLFSAKSPEDARLAKTQLEGAMYERLPRHGRIVALPKPFVYSLQSTRNGREACSVIFYDNAGEHFQPGINVVEQPGAQHVANAAGILFLFDPFNSPEFRRKLANTTTDPQIEKQPLDQQDVILAEMRARIQGLRNLRVGQKIQTPLAVLIGKADSWLHLLSGELLSEPIANGAVQIGAINQNSKRLREFLVNLCPTVVANAEALSDDVRYFAVSAFGHTPVRIGPGAYVPDPARLAPMHVEAPVLWLISKFAAHIVSTKD